MLDEAEYGVVRQEPRDRDRPEGAGAQRLAVGEAMLLEIGHRRRLTECAISGLRRRALDRERHQDQQHDRHRRVVDESLPPTEGLDERWVHQREDRTAETGADQCDADGETTMPHEPARHQKDDRHRACGGECEREQHRDGIDLVERHARPRAPELPEETRRQHRCARRRDDKAEARGEASQRQHAHRRDAGRRHRSDQHDHGLRGAVHQRGITEVAEGEQQAPGHQQPTRVHAIDEDADEGRHQGG